MYTLFPSTTLFRSHGRLEEIDLAGKVAEGQEEALKRSSHRCRPGASPYGIQYLAWLSRDSQAFSQTVIAGLVPAIHASTRLLRSEEHTSELQSLMRTSYAVFCLKKKKKTQHQ